MRGKPTAGQQLRVGNTDCIDTYAAHGRLHDGPAEAMSADAYTRVGNREPRRPKRVTHRRRQRDRRRPQHPSPHQHGCAPVPSNPTASRLHDDTVAGVGDTIVTRRNRRDLRTSTGAWVRNGDLWIVTARADDGSLIAQRKGGGTSRTSRSAVRLPPDYVAEHVELGYATTAHRAQGMTVDATFTILRPGMSRELAYVAMTRGRAENHAFIATDIPDLGYDGAPAPDQTGRRFSNRSSPVPVRRRRRPRPYAPCKRRRHRSRSSHRSTKPSSNRATAPVGSGHRRQRSLPTTNSARSKPHPRTGRWSQHCAEPNTTDTRCTACCRRSSPRQASTPVTTRPANVRPARDLAAVLHHRVTVWHERTMPPTGHRTEPLIGGLITPAGQLDTDVPAEQRTAIEQLEALMTSRARALTQQALQNPPTWLRALGAPPADPRRRAHMGRRGRTDRRVPRPLPGPRTRPPARRSRAG